MTDPHNLSNDAADQAKTPSPLTQYWSANLKLLGALLAIWFIVSFGAGILLAEPLNAVRLGGYPLGFWFAQQGAIYVFVGLIFFYAHKMKAIDERFGADNNAADSQPAPKRATLSEDGR